MRVRQFFAGALALAMAMTLIGCAMVDRDSLRIRNNGLARDLYSVPGVLDVELDDDAVHPNVNYVDVYVRLDYDRGADTLTDDLAAVRQKLDDGDFDYFTVTAEIDDSRLLPHGARLAFDSLPTEAQLRDEAALWFDLIGGIELTALSYEHRGGDRPRVIVLADAAVAADGTVLDDAELIEAITAVWLAAGRDVDQLVVNP